MLFARGFNKIALLVVAVAVVFLLPGADAQQAIGFEASVVRIKPQISMHSYPSKDLHGTARTSDDQPTSTTWRVIENTGNCCENFVTTTPEGRILDFGGSYINFSDDKGKTWRSVRPMEPLVNGEGAIALAPGGDIVGVEWDPYSGDHLMSFKYEAKDDKWYYNEIPVHTPFFDREWIAAVPGPFTVGPITTPYVTFVRGAWPSKELWFVSLDGLNYSQVSSKFVETAVNDPIKKMPSFVNRLSDWTQVNTETGITPIGKGAALAAPDFPFGGDGGWTLLGKDLRWHPFTFGKVVPKGRYHLDSRGRLHNVIGEGSAFTYRISADNGKTWKSVNVAPPKDHAIENIDFRANAAAGVAAVGIHSHDRETNRDRDILYKINIRRNTPKLMRYYQIGKADVNGSSGVGAEVRFDFETVTIFPDGRVAISFYDSTTMGKSATTGADQLRPALAIEGKTSRR
jgi:hypothetical protein